MRKRKSFPMSNAVIITLIAFILQYESLNRIFNYNLTSKNRWKHLVKGKIPKRDAAEAIIKQIDGTELLEIHNQILRKIYRNKTVRKGTIGRYVVVGIDGTELFTSKKKCCKDCLTREHKNGTIEYFHRSVVCMTVGSDPHIILGQEMLFPRDGNEKDEGELTGGKRLVNRLYAKHHHFADIIVADALYLNAPFINCVLSKGMDVVIRAKDENRLIVKDALGLFSKGYGKKESFRNNKVQIEVWDISGFEMNGVKSSLRFLQFVEYHEKSKEIRTMWVVTTSNVDYKIIWEIMHKRWDIEENGFHQLKTYYHVDHCFSHEAIESIFMLNIIAFNLREMYLFRRIKDFRSWKITRKEVSIRFNDDLLIYDFRHLLYDG